MFKQLGILEYEVVIVLIFIVKTVLSLVIKYRNIKIIVVIYIFLNILNIVAIGIKLSLLKNF